MSLTNQLASKWHVGQPNRDQIIISNSVQILPENITPLPMGQNFMIISKSNNIAISSRKIFLRIQVKLGVLTRLKEIGNQNNID